MTGTMPIIEIERASDFFCQGCLEDKPLEDISPDPRYCFGCHEVLSAEAKMLPGIKRKWVPKAPRAKTGRKKEAPVAKGVSVIMSQPKNEMSKEIKVKKAKKVKVGHNSPATSKAAPKKRGPKCKSFPEGLIIGWASEGLSNRAIATILKVEYDIVISYKTIQRILKGQRVLV